MIQFAKSITGLKTNNFYRNEKNMHYWALFKNGRY